MHAGCSRQTGKQRHTALQQCLFPGSLRDPDMQSGLREQMQA